MRALVQRREDAQHRVVEEAEAVRPVPQAVMGPAGRAEDDAALAQQADGVKRRAGRSRRAPENLAENRIAVDAEIEARALFVGRHPVPLALPDGRDIVRVVKPGELFDGSDRAVDILRIRQPAERAAQVDGKGDTRNRQRMFAAVARFSINLTADEPGCRHDSPEIAQCRARSSIAPLASVRCMS